MNWHLKRHDLLWNWLPTVVGWLLFFHPLVWLLRRGWFESQEAASDELLIQNQAACPSEYGRLLLKLSAHWSQKPQSSLAAAGVLGAYRNLERRILAMAHVKPFSGRRLMAAASVLAVMATLCVVPWRLVAQESNPKKDDSKPTGQVDADNDDHGASSRVETKPSAPHHSAGLSTKVDDIVRAWELREKNTSSFQVAWTEKVFRSAESLANIRLPAIASTAAPSVPASLAEGLRYEDNRSLSTSGDRYRIEYKDHDGGIFFGKELKIFSRDEISASDGKQFRSLKRPSEISDHPNGTIMGVDRRHGIDDSILPFLLEFRPLSQFFLVVKKSDIGSDIQEEVIDGFHCLVFDAGRWKCWVDPSRDYVVVRCESVGSTATRFDIQYATDQAGQWYPSAWAMTWKGPRVDYEITAKVTEFKINSPIVDSDFVIEFPPNTYVVDYTSGRLKQYILRTDGSHRDITDAELASGAKYEQLLKTPSGEGSGQSPKSIK